jgi:Cys-rich repeat protein
MTLRRLVLALALAVLAVACVRQVPSPRGDVLEGPCRVDADCASGQVCRQHRAHLRDASGDITGDLVTYACVPAARDAG